MKMKHAADYAHANNAGTSIGAMKRGFTAMGDEANAYDEMCQHCEGETNDIMPETVGGFLPRDHGFSR